MPSGLNNKINDHEKQNLFSAYRRYSGYVRKLEAYIRSNTQGNLADQKFINEYKTDIRRMSSFPWHMEDAGEQNSTPPYRIRTVALCILKMCRKAL